MTRAPTPALVQDQLELYRRMWVLRLLDMALEESRIDGLLDGPRETAFGQEAVAVGITAALRPRDVMTTTIPHLRHALRAGLALPLGPAIAQLIDPSLCDSQERTPVGEWKLGLHSASTPLARSVLSALGDADAQRRAGAGEVTLLAIADRDASTVEFTVAATIASSWRLPVVFVVEDIRAVSGPRADRCPRGRHGMPVLSNNGKDVGAVRDSVAEAVRRTGVGEGPVLVNAVTYRSNHPVGLDPLVSERRRLIDGGVSCAQLYEVERRARHLVAEAESFATAMVRAEEAAPVREPERWPAIS